MDTKVDNIVRLRLLTYNARLLNTRLERGFRNRNDLADAAGLSRTYLGLIEGLKRVPTEDEICALAAVLEKLPDYLFPEELLSAVKRGLFSKRTAELTELQVRELGPAERQWLLTDGGIEAAEDHVDSEILRQKINEVFDTLSLREAKALNLRFGLDDGRARTCEEVGHEFNLTGGRIQQIENKALRRLRHPTRSRELKGFLR